jgi:hypothetical protein
VWSLGNPKLWSSRAGPQKFAHPWRNRSFAPQLCSHIRKGRVLQSYSCCTEVARQSQPPTCQFRNRQADCVTGAVTPATPQQVVRALPRHPLPLLWQHVLPWNKPHPALALGFFLVRHLAHVDGVAPSRVLHRALVVLGGVVVDVVIRVVCRRVVAVVPC